MPFDLLHIAFFTIGLIAGGGVVFTFAFVAPDEPTPYEKSTATRDPDRLPL